MNGVDIYLKLIDDEEYNQISEFYGYRNNSMELKKINIGKILKRRLKPMENDNSDPFFPVILLHKVKELKGLDKKTFFCYLAYEDNEIFPPYKKFANALLYYPQTTKSFYNKIEQNINNNKEIFQDLMEFELNDYKNLIVNMMGINRVGFIDKCLESIENNFTIEDYENIHLAMKKVKHWTLKDLISCKDEDKYILYYAYLNTHSLEDKELKLCLLIKLLLNVASENLCFKQKEEINNYMNKIGEGKKEEDNFQNIKKELETLKKEKREIEKENKNINRNLKNLQYIFSNKENEYKTKYKLIEEKYKETLKRVKFLESYNNMNLNCEDIKKQFIVIVPNETNLPSKIFKEGLFINAKDIRTELKNYETKKLKNIFINRVGISSKNISKIERIARENHMKSQVFIAFSEKEIIEKISILKNNLKEDI